MARKPKDPNAPNPKMGLNLKRLSPRSLNAVLDLARRKHIEPADAGLMILEAAARDAGHILAEYHRREAEFLESTAREGQESEG